ncbi:MAG: ribonuclease HI [Bacteroidales bacterium]|nr:ribonuclease HI [Bacteroidales bacterium]
MSESIQLNRFFFKITACQAQEYRILIRSEKPGEECFLGYTPLTKSLVFIDDNSLSNYLKTHEHQLRKMLHNKRLDTFFIGFELYFIIWKDKDIKQFSNRSNVIALDRRTSKRKIYITKNENIETTNIFTDGSFLEKRGKGGYVVLIKRPNKNYQLHTYESGKKSSSLIELEAAIKGLEILKDVEKIRIISDSQYVRKGLTEWVPIWELNDWHTVNGEKVKNIGYWKYFNSLSIGKYIEFEWVKAHDNHFENTICDLYAKRQALSD